MKKYYLKKMQSGLMTDKEVAEKLSMSVLEVQRQFVRFCLMRQTRPKYKRIERWEIFAHILTLISILLVWQTLREMQVQRKVSYAPELAFDTNVAVFFWNDDGNTVSVTLNEKFTQANSRYFGKDPIGIANSLASRQEMKGIRVVNVGNAAARSVKARFDKQNFDEFIAAAENYINLAQESIGVKLNKQILTYASSISDGRKPALWVSIDDDITWDITYIPKFSEEDTETILPLPEEYYQLIAVIGVMASNQEVSDVYSALPQIPLIKFSLEYSDMQGNKYELLQEVEVQLTPWIRVDDKKNMFAILTPSSTKIQ